MLSTLWPPAKEIESDSWMGVELALFSLCHPLLGWSAAGAVCPLTAGSHCGVVLGEGLPGGSCWQRQLWLCVSSKSLCPFQLPLLPLHFQRPPSQPSGPHPCPNPCFSQSWESIWACVCSPELRLCSQTQSDWLAQMWQAYRNARNAEALERVCPSLAQGRRGGATSVSADSSALLCWLTAGLTGWLVWWMLQACWRWPAVLLW